MGSPIHMQPFVSLLTINKTDAQPVYLQLANQLTALIRKGILLPGQRLPSTRELATLLTINRRTIVKAYDDLLAQGWFESHTGNGTFVSHHLPKIQPQTLPYTAEKQLNPGKKAGFYFTTTPHLYRSWSAERTKFHLDDGLPDTRQAPLEELSRAYRSQLLTGDRYMRLGYGDPNGSLWLRQELAAYLSETRGLKITPENILIVRGTIMGIYLVSNNLLQAGDNVVVGELSWLGANVNFLQTGANLLKIPVDEYGIDIDALEQLCRQQPIRLVYVTSHHHYPTTVALRPDRRIRLLRLAEEYGFIIFEDDYDYDFHYPGKPLLPLASADHAGMVLYCGSFSKAISPAFRIGYLVGSEDVIQHLAKLRRNMDRQGDIILENAIAELLQGGIIQRHLRKSLRLYKERRDVFCALLKTYLNKYATFQVPDGGMAVWTAFDPQINLTVLAQNARRKDLYFSDGAELGVNATRLGFASSTPEELEQSVSILAKLIEAGAA